MVDKLKFWLVSSVKPTVYKGFRRSKILILGSFLLSVCIGVAIVLIASRFQVYAKDRIPLPIADD
ncbi:MAG: hypothetical protein RIG63_28045 [Coleofasciculus chthonoplastes F3-SA18-01]|uniref:hypothetical protein n=1 Tax=Coleofasciculus chthonoplastes TaxID=64178 RepID=UPI0033013B36